MHLIYLKLTYRDKCEEHCIDWCSLCKLFSTYYWLYNLVGLHVTFLKLKFTIYLYLMTFQVILAILLSWAFCAALTLGGVFPEDPEALGYGARTDTKLSVLSEAKWFRFPYPCMSNMNQPSYKVFLLMNKHSCWSFLMRWMLQSSRLMSMRINK